MVKLYKFFTLPSAKGTATAGTSNGQAHSANTTVQDATLWTGFGDAVFHQL